MKDSKTLRERFEERFRNTFSDLTEDSEEDFAYTRLTEDVLSFLESEIALAKKEAYKEVIEEIMPLSVQFETDKTEIYKLRFQLHLPEANIGEYLSVLLRNRFLSESPKEV